MIGSSVRRSLVSRVNVAQSWKDLEDTSFSTDLDWLASHNALKTNGLLDPNIGLSNAQATAIHKYTVENSELTRGAYGDSLTAEQQEWIDLVESGLDSLRPTNLYEGTVFRGVNRPESEIIDRFVTPFNDSLANGGVPSVNEPALLSTSTESSVAQRFIDENSTPESVQVMFEIESTRGVDIDNISAYGENLNPGNIEREVILSSNQDYDILDVVRTVNPDGSIRYLIKLAEQ